MTTRALLIGINYYGTSSKLNGCINDVKNVFKYLKDNFQVVNEVKLSSLKDLPDVTLPETEGGETADTRVISYVQHLKQQFEEIIALKPLATSPTPAVPITKITNLDMSKATVEVLILTDEPGTSALHIPTRANILAGFQWLVKNATKDSRLFLHYSGHGSNQRDLNGDEEDKMDETICPVDYASGMITDDEIRKQLVDPLPEGANLRCLFDCCHSQSVCDLPFNFIPYQNTAKKNAKVKETKANVITWSGCQDNQTSADAWINRDFNGAMTATFLEVLRDPKQDKSYKAVYLKLSELLAKRNYDQKAQLSSGKQMDLTTKFDFF